jgi:lipid A 3-O-deacylase
MIIWKFVDSKFYTHFFLFIILCNSASFAGGSRDYFSFSSALFDILQEDEASLEGRIEYRVNSLEWNLKPFAGFMANTDGALHFYTGMYSEIPVTSFITIIPSFAPGLYFKNNSKDLHFTLVFRSQMEVIFNIQDYIKAGFSFNHISNASLGDTNPGVESFAITFQFPVF